MPTGSTKSRHSKLIGTKQAAEVLLLFAARESESHISGTRAEWYMTATQLLSRQAAVPALELLVWQAGHELGRWPLHAMAYGSLVSGLAQQPEGPFAIPHAKGFFYDDYAEVGSRLAAAEQVLAELIPPYNALLYRMCRTERAAGLSVSKVKSWLKQAEDTLNATKGEVLRQLISAVGPPRFATHSSYLLELLPAVQLGTELLKAFLMLSPAPVGPPEGDERATVGAEESRWDWKELSLSRREYSADLAMKKYEYLPEVEVGIAEAPGDFSAEQPRIRLGEILLPKAVEHPSIGAVRNQLLEIRQRVDDLLASMDG